MVLRRKPAAFGSFVAIKHRAALDISGQLTKLYCRMYRPMSRIITPQRVLKVLEQAGVKCLLVGAHGIGGWKSQARSTEDIDVLVAVKHHSKAVKAIQHAFPKLVMADSPVATRFSDKRTGKGLIDLMKPVDEPFKLAFKYSVPVGKTHRVPDLEMALVAKFAARVAPDRRPLKKHADASDFIDMVEHNLDKIKIKKLEQLAEKVYQGGAKEITQLFNDIKAGRSIQI